MKRLQFDPNQETELQAILRSLRTSAGEGEFKTAKSAADRRIKTLRKTSDTVSAKLIRSKGDGEYLKQIDWEICLLQRAIAEGQDRL